MHPLCVQLCNPSVTLWRNPAAIQDTAAFPPLPPPPLLQALHPDLVSLFPTSPRPSFSAHHTHSLPTGLRPPALLLQPTLPLPEIRSPRSQPKGVQWPSLSPDQIPAPGPIYTCSGAGPAWAPLSFPAIPRGTAISSHSRAPSCFMPLHLALCTGDSRCLERPFQSPCCRVKGTAPLTECSVCARPFVRPCAFTTLFTVTKTLGGLH